jgi:glycosyltransferase involved in cell wall biosynthesis
VFRIVKFAKYLPDYGYEPLILTVKNGSYPSLDESLLNEINPKIKVFKSKSVEPFAMFNKFFGKKGKSVPVGMSPQKNDSAIKKLMFYIRSNFFIPDARKGWNRFAYREAKKIIEKESLTHFITTGPPHSTHLVGLKLQKNYSLKWLADLRDPWTNIFYNKVYPRSERTKMKDGRFENAVVCSADAITVVSKGMKDEFSDRAKKIEIIQNGFDQNDIPEKEITTTSVFKLSYIGNFKPNQNVENLWKAISAIKNENKVFAQHFRLQLTGNISQVVLDSLEKHAISDLKILESHVSHATAVKKMVESNLLLFIVPQAENNKAIITGKLFEYLASQTPVFSIGPCGGDAAEIIRAHNRNEMIDYQDVEKIKVSLLQHFAGWQKDKKTVKALSAELWNYTRQGLTEKLAKTLNSM